MRLTEAEYDELMRRRAVPERSVVATEPESAEKRWYPGHNIVDDVARGAVTLNLPFPPSANTIWRSLRSGPMAGRVLLSKPGREYRAAVIDAVCEQNAGRVVFGERVGVEIALYPPTRRKLDIDNRAKALLDGLTHAGLWHDDEQIDVLIVRREEVRKGGEAIVRAWNLETEPA